MAALSDVLRDAMGRAGVGSQTLSKLTGVPRTAIDNWREGVVRRPRHWRPLARIARVLSLSRVDTDALLAAAGYPGVATLAGGMTADHPDRENLYPWLAQLGPPARRQLRAPASDFVGRESALDTLLAALRSHQGAAAISGVRGMGGIGKTELAVLAASRLSDTFPDGQLMVSLHGVNSVPLPAAQALRQVVHAFTPDAQLPDEVEALQRRYCAVLSGHRVLIVADDAANAAQIRPLMPPAGCALLVTSRQRFTLPGMVAVDLEQLTEVEAVALLERICGRIPHPLAPDLAAACGYLPLALRISGSLLRNDPALAVPDYLAVVSDRRQRLDRLRDPDDPHLDVAVSLGLSYERLDPPTQAVLRRLGVLVADFDTELAEAVVQAPAGVDVEASLRLLLRRNLVEYEPDEGRWRLHDLAQDLARRYLDEAGELAATTWSYAEAAVRVAEETQRLYLAGGDAIEVALARFDRQRPHLDAMRRWATEHSGTERGDRLLLADADASYYLGFLRYDRRDEITPQAHNALAAARRLGDRRAEGIVLNRLGHLHLDLGQVDQAISYHEQQLALVQSSDDAAGEARALNNLAVAYTQFGHLRAAISVNERQLALVRAQHDRRREAMALCNLGRTYLSLGQPDRGLMHLEPALAIACELGDRHGEAIVLSNVGDAYLASGDAAAAMDRYQAAYVIALELGDPHLEAEVRADLVPAAAALGRAQEGIEHGDRALAMAREMGAHQAEAKALQALGRCYATTGDVGRARAAFEEALTVLRTIGDRYSVAETSWHLGCLLADENRALALPLLRAAVSYQEEIGHALAGERAAMLAGLS